jgi:hypothetical protein
MQNIEMSELKKQIHCKLTYKDQIRRFIFHGTEFAELRGHISNLLSLPFDGFVLKYVDNESDLITLTSNEDLSVALDISDKLLRLVVDPSSSSLSSPKSPDPSPLIPPTSSDQPLSHSYRSGHGGHFHHHHGGGHHHHGGGHWNHHGGFGGGGFQQTPHPHGGGGGFQPEKAKFRIQSKIDYLKTQLEQNPQEDWKRQQLLMKIHRLEGRLLRWEGIQEKKMNKKKWKEERKWEKKSHGLSPDALQQVQTLKTQIASLKPVLYQLKVTKKAKKSELELFLQSGQGDKESIWNEILKLKESINETQKQILSFKDQIRAIRG